MTSAPRIRVLFDEEHHCQAQRGAGPGDRGRQAREPARRGRAQGQLHVRRRSDPRPAPGRAGAAGRVRAPVELSRRHRLLRQVAILRDVESDVRGRDVLLVDDILESGRTVTFAKDLLMARGAKSVKTAVLLEKPGKRAVSIDAGFCRLHLPGRVRRRLRHGRGPFLSPAALRRRRRSPRQQPGPVRQAGVRKAGPISR